MSELSLNFLEDDYSKNQTTYVDLLEKYGTEICTYGKGYFDRVVTSTEFEGEVQDVSLYILVPEISFEFRIMNIEIININTVKVSLFSLTRNTAVSQLDISGGIAGVEKKVKEYLGSGTANESLKLLVSKVNLKRKSNQE